MVVDSSRYELALCTKTCTNMNLEIYSKFPAVLTEDIFHSLKCAEDLANFLVGTTSQIC